MRRALVIGPASEALGDGLGAHLAIPIVKALVRNFPDGECCVSVTIPPDLDEVIILQGTHAPQDRHLQQLYQLVEVAAARRAKRIVCVVPYLAYARQDRRSSRDEPLSIAIVMRCLAALGAHCLVSVDVHNPDSFNDGPIVATNLAAAPLFVDFLRDRLVERMVLVSPDRGGSERLSAVATRLGLPLFVYDKFKDRAGLTHFGGCGRSLAGKHAVVIDDLCSSGSTLKPLARQLLQDGATDYSICVTHLLADAKRLNQLLGEGMKLICTDSVPEAPATLSIVPVLADFLGREASMAGSRQ